MHKQQSNLVQQLEQSLNLNSFEFGNAANYQSGSRSSRSHIGRPTRNAAAEVSPLQKDFPSAPLNQSLDDEEDNSFWAGGVINVPDRAGATSAPPVLGSAVQPETLFAFRALYANIFSDIRCEQNYNTFYQQYKDSSKLPKPFEPEPFVAAQHSPRYKTYDQGLASSSPLAIQNNYEEQVQAKLASSPPLRYSFKDVMLPDLSDSDVNTPAPEESSAYAQRMRQERDAVEKSEPRRLWEQYEETISRKPASEPTLAKPHHMEYIDHPASHATAMGINRGMFPSRYNVSTVPNIPNIPNVPVSPDVTSGYPPPFYAGTPAASIPPPGFSFGMPPHGPVPMTPQQPQIRSPASPAGYSQPMVKVQPDIGDSRFFGDGSEKKQGSRKKGSGTSPRIAPQSLGHDVRYTSIDQVVGQIYSLCKDQHGCRFLQKKLEDNNPAVTELIFNETYPHFDELMTDPFGNYLCQKLLEYCNNNQRLLAIRKVAANLVSISKNMHGTRAVQKMIECLCLPEQVALVREGLRDHVVDLIQDLNGNHVIQRCLHKLSSVDNQFIYDAVAGHCVEVATHRHGCCVLQRCLDHASNPQKLQLVREIIANALPLVQDPYGNYVVQYVLDLPFNGITGNVANQLSGQLCALSCQKFSSNVIEKVIKKVDERNKEWMVRELMEPNTLVRLLQDPFGNYVIQTCLSATSTGLREELIEAIKPHLPALRNTPYGKRIQNKIAKA